MGMKALKAHVWDREANEHYVEPQWCSARLFDEERFDGTVWDPCCGFGRIPSAAISAGYLAVGTDIKDRGYGDFGGVWDFLKDPAQVVGQHSIVCNPPFNIAPQFALRALELVDKVAMVFPTARLNAAHWLQGTPLARVWMMTPRPSMPPGHTITAGQKPGGGKMDYCWLVWVRGFSRAPEIKWLRRDSVSNRVPVASTENAEHERAGR